MSTGTLQFKATETLDTGVARVGPVDVTPTNPLPVNTSVGGAVVSAANPLPTTEAPYPLGATPITAASGNVANGSAAATLAAHATKTTYITGFEITAGGSTGAALVVATLVGAITGTLSYIFGTPAGATLIATPLIVQFSTPIPGSAVNTAIVVTLPALGAGNTHASVVAHGYQL